MTHLGHVTTALGVAPTRRAHATTTGSSTATRQLAPLMHPAPETSMRCLFRLAVKTLLIVNILSFTTPAAARKDKPAKTSADDEAQEALRVPVRVVDVAGGRAYIEPGAAKHLRVGDTVTFRKAEFSIVSVSTSSAAIELGDRRLEVGARGSSQSVKNRPIEAAKKLPEPTPVASFRDDWKPATRPATTQSPKAVPLGVSDDARRNRVQFSAAAYAVLPQDAAQRGFVSAELRGRLHVEPISSMPLALDADVGAFYVGPNDRVGSRQLLRLRELAATYGTDVSWRSSLGRLRYASSMLGNLDGVRVDAPLGSNFRLGAFGGLMPNPETGTFSADVARFGSELVWQNDEAAWHPRMVLGAHASQFDGAVDERKTYALVDFLPSFGQLGARAELSFFDDNNVWNAPTTDLTGASAYASAQHGAFFARGHADFSRPERSRFLASLFPPEWLCRGTASLVPPEPCIGGDATYGGGVAAGLRGTTSSVTLGAEASAMTNTDVENSGVFAVARWLDIYESLRLDLGASQSSGSLIRATTFTLAPGYTFETTNLDITLRYQPAFMRYTTDSAPFVQHALGTTLWFSPLRSFDLTLSAELNRGRDFNATIVQSVAVWRPGL